MIEIREGSLITKLLYILTVAGEFPMCSISLLGSYRRYMQLIGCATQCCTYFNYVTKESYTATLLTIVGKGRQKSLRFLSGAERVLEWLELWELFRRLHGEIHYRGDEAHRNRAHRLAEGYAMAYMAGLEINPLRMPTLQQDRFRNFFVETQCYYDSKKLKGLSRIELPKNMYTRIIGAVFANKNVYAVYNTRDQVMKWCGKGEQKALVNLEEISRMNANTHRVNSAILFGKDMGIALETLKKTDNTKRLEYCFDGIYSQIYFVPLDQNGIRLFRLLIMEEWREELLSTLFPEETRSYDKGVFEYDAQVDNKFVFAFFDGNIARLQRFRYAAQKMNGEYEVLCFPFQVEFVKAYLGDLVKIKTAKLEVIEDAIGIGGGK